MSIFEHGIFFFFMCLCSLVPYSTVVLYPIFSLARLMNKKKIITQPVSQSISPLVSQYLGKAGKEGKVM